jgi:glutathione S-transferase
MTIAADRAAIHTLWGTPHSLYTGKIRSYLIKKGVPFREIFPPHPRFRSQIRPAIRLRVAPVIETPDGLILQDTTDMIEHLEAQFPEPLMVPRTPLQRAVAWLIDAFGSEALLPAAMSYRWTYRAEQERFLRAEFGRGIHSGPDRDARLAAGLKFMDYFNDTLPRLGVTAETLATVEAAYLELLDALDVHFQHHPYLLGGRPSIADAGMMAPLYAHLARDPVPATLMKNCAPNVYRWTERMNLASIADGEFPDYAETYSADDDIPRTLEPVLRLIFQDWGPELVANAALYNSWVAADPVRPPGCPVSTSDERVVHPTIGPVEYTLRGQPFRRASAPHGLWHFEKAAALARALTGEAAERFANLVRRNGGDHVMAITLARPMARRDYLLVLV